MTMTFQTVIERFRATALSNRERGDKFEALVKRFLQLDPLYAGLFSDVWLWMEWPGRGGRGDTGIDLVAREADSGELWAIQCKFYEHGHTVSRKDIDTFLSASGKTGFAKRLIVSTTDGTWGDNAEAVLIDQQVPVQRIGLSELAAAPIDWSFAGPPEELNVSASPAKKNEPRPHQREAIDAVLRGFAEHDRGKLIMACGTGKTFTSLAIAERLAAKQNGRARVLFLVPSIALLGQTLREWSANTVFTLHAFAVCSDVKVGRTRASNDLEDIHVHDLAIPATTDTKALAAAMHKSGERAGLTVVFSTYQSIAVVSQAQRDGVSDFDLVVCDEAHRTTGITLGGTDESHFVRVHDPSFIRSSRRLYMTATPRLYSDTTKKQATEADALLVSMDDDSLYGPEFHRLSFGVAVERGLLTDYKVLVLTVDEGHVAETMQRQLADENSVLNLDDMAKIIGCWNALAKRTGNGEIDIDFGGDVEPMNRAVAFVSTIKGSEEFARVTPKVTKYVPDAEVDRLNLEVQHVDGTMNALKRAQRLDWLKAPVASNECRILSNARCLSEGVDVPDLDAVLFLSPRNSDVDVVQSVGRVMRKTSDKQYGYIILPLAVAAGVQAEEALRDHKTFKAVWQVLQALRAHDERFDAIVNTIELNPTRARQKIGIGHVGAASDEDGLNRSSNDDEGAGGLGAQLILDLPEWREAIYARIVQKVGVRTYWEDWANDVADIATAQQTRIRALLNGANPKVTKAFEAFVKALRANLNESITADGAIGMLSQHLITKPVFDALFEDYAFAEHNPVSQAMERMVASIGDQNLDTETERLQGFYDSVRRRAEGIENAEGKQKIITELYERFFRKAFSKTAASLGIVYTPTEIVDFILHGADDALRQEFGMAITGEGVHVLDPFTGTGTFIARLLQSGLIKPEDLLRKYTQELHANELLLLAYYIAAVNIEATYHGIAGGEYVPFEGIALTDTFQISEEGDLIDEIVMPANNARIGRQLDTDVTVIVGNPPYSVGQTSANDNNQNLEYPTLDGRIERTYAARATSTSKRALYDSYIRAIRWATDRIGERGIVAFVTNGGWIDGKVHSGIRLSLADELSALYVYNLRGNARTSGELRRQEKDNVFGQGARTTAAIFVGVRNPAHTGSCAIYYRDIGDYLTREQKLAILNVGSLASVEWTAVVPNEHGDWVNHRDDAFAAYSPIGSEAKGDGDRPAVFSLRSKGLLTARDAWVYGASRKRVVGQMKKTIEVYTALAPPFAAYCRKQGVTRPKEANVKAFVGEDPARRSDPTRISWSRSLMQSLARGTKLGFESDHIGIGLYRPFEKRFLYYDPALNHERSQLPRMFPTPQHSNIGIYIVGRGSDVPFSALATDVLPNLHVTGAGSGGQFFSRWRYEPVAPSATAGADLFGGGSEPTTAIIDGYRRIDNVTDEILAEYRATFDPSVTKDEIFHYVYGVLHSQQYRETFAADLKKMLPRIPKAASLDDFHAFVEAGVDLADLHVRYEAAPPHELEEQLTGAVGDDPYELYRITKMRFANRGERDTIIYNEHLTLVGIPEEVHRYQLGSRSAIEWIIERYRVTTHKESGIVNDPNDWSREQRNPRYIVDLIKSIVTVSLKTMKIVDSLPVLPLGRADG